MAGMPWLCSEGPQYSMHWARGIAAREGRHPRGGLATETWGNELAGEKPVVETGVWSMHSGGQEGWGSEKA